MKIFYRHATMFLIEKLHSIRYFPNSWRCIHLQLSGKKERYNRTLRTHFILKGFNELLSNEEGYVYLCGDGDIIILFQGRVTPILQKLSTYFADIDPVRYADRFDRFFTTYDLSRDWAAFSGMCHTKSLSGLWDPPIKSLPVGGYLLELSPAP